MTTAAASTLDRAAALDRFARIRTRTRTLFDLLDDSAYYTRPIPLRNPVVFYEGHLPAFAVNTLLKRALGRRGIDEALETIFARGIDPESEANAIARGNPAWPSRAAVREYATAADRAIEDAIRSADLDRAGHPLLHRAQALWAILEHEEMHQETLAYMWHQLPHEVKRKPVEYVTVPPAPDDAPTADPQGRTRSANAAAAPARVLIPAGTATLGTRPGDAVFAWDNELPAHRVTVDAFSIDAHNVTNADFMRFVEAGGYRDPRWWRPADWSWVVSDGVTHPRFWERHDDQWYWRAMFERVPLPASWPVYVTWAEANAYACWRGERLPTEAEFHRAAFGTPDGRERQYPWGDDPRGPAPGLPAAPDLPRGSAGGAPGLPRRSAEGAKAGNFDFARWDPEPVGAYPQAASAFGVHDLVGNGWEWTSTSFAPFEGFVPLPSYPEYSADFFDGDHFVMKGASPVTARALARRGFRNWFRPCYPYVYATFRCVGPAFAPPARRRGAPAFDESSAEKPA
jgi:gamma-glutamyl hercynylcysteine S-oxide synthase